ncbi:hypothetical protein C8R43DRAFT_1143824 [Mycena crocata]|nr:hypothetical protein C8R43DRAFT_1143824 [Mycena crocata]
MEEMTRVLGLDVKDPDFCKYVQIVAGDQLTIARQRLADCHGLLETHFGKPSAGARSPGSLGFHNTVLDRLPITLTSLPPFRTCRDLIMVSLYARVLHCLLLVSGHDSLEDYAAAVDSWDTVVSHATQIYEKYANAKTVQELRERRIPEERSEEAQAKAAKKSSDTGTSEFTDAVKRGDSGCILIVPACGSSAIAGVGELRNVILQNWLANPTGKPDSFVEIDLVQEHLNFWIKKVYKADVEGHSWDWLALLLPCIHVLRKLATQINTDLGARQGAKHTIPGLEDDITELMESLDEQDVYVLTEGRVLNDDKKPVPDVLSVGETVHSGAAVKSKTMLKSE